MSMQQPNGDTTVVTTPKRLVHWSDPRSDPPHAFCLCGTEVRDPDPEGPVSCVVCLDLGGDDR